MRAFLQRAAMMLLAIFFLPLAGHAQEKCTAIECEKPPVLEAPQAIEPKARDKAWMTAEVIDRMIEETNFMVNNGCSGTLISLTERLILTNYHCIDRNIETVEREVTTDEGFVRKVKQKRYKDVPVEQNRYNGYTKTSTTTFVSTIVAESKQRDLALLQISGKIPNTFASPLLPKGDDLVRGQRVWVVGNPAMQENSLVEGVVSNVNRTFEFPWTDREKLPMIQFSGGITGGNSGGALYNGYGELIGVPAAVRNDANFIGLAIPSTVVWSFLKENCYLTDDDAKCREAKKAKAEKAKKADD